MNVRMTWKQAAMLGIVFCRQCGCRPNKHFDWGKKPCAGCDCERFVRMIVLPKPEMKKGI